MPKQPRWAYKRDFDAAISHLMKAGEYLIRLGNVGFKDHPSFSEDMRKAMLHILEAGRLCEVMKERV